MAEQQRKSSANEAAPAKAPRAARAFVMAPPANDNPVPRALVLARAFTAALALGAVAWAGYLMFR